MHVHISNGRVIDPANKLDQLADVYIRDGRIAAIGKKPAGFTAEKILDAKGKIVCPGFVDLNTRLREPGFEHKASIESETLAAASGGITTMCCPPDTNPIIDTPAVAELIHQRAAKFGKAKVVCSGALTSGLQGKQLSEMLALKEAGCVVVSNGYSYVHDTLVMRRAMEYADGNKLTVFIYAEDPWLKGQGVVHEGQMSTRMGLAGVPDIAETIAVARILALVERTGARTHFSSLSTANAVRMIARAQHEGLPVTADVSAHQLHLTEMDIMDFNSDCHVRPPLRTRRDLEGLRRGVAEGRINAISANHQPHDLDAKLGPFSGTEPGISGLETLLPLALRLVHENVLPLSDMIATITCKPAAILGINAGTLTVNAPADVCIFDPDTLWTFSKDAMLSRGKNTPFHGWDFKGKVNHTLLDGKLVFSAQ